MKYSDTKEFFNKHKNQSLEKHLKDLKSVKECEEKTEEFLKMFRENFFGEDDTKAKIFFYELINQHRTHQQSIIKNLFKALKLYSDCWEKGWFDARNEQAVAWAKEVTGKDTVFPCI
jgi:hypothetical protein